MSELDAMQRAAHHSALSYHILPAGYFVVLHPESRSPSEKERADQCTPAAEGHRARLRILLDYPLMTRAREVIEQEVDRIRRLIRSLDLAWHR